MGAVLQFQLVVEHQCNCITCSTPIFMDSHVANEFRRNHKSFYCINGHSQCWPGKSDLEKLREELDWEKRRRESAEASRDTARRAEASVRGRLRAQSERVANGVCPCCKRTFQNLMRHMSTKHPGFKSEAAT